MTSTLAGHRVLVVEDEMVVSWWLEEMLNGLGCLIAGPVARVAEALKMIETAPAFDVAILDLNLNGQDSYPVADALVARHIPFAFGTGYNKDSLREAYRNFPMLQKPYGEAQLREVLLKLLPSEKPVFEESPVAQGSSVPGGSACDL